MNILYLISKINGLIIAFAMVFGFFHFAYLFFKTYFTKLPLTNDFSKKEIQRVSKDYIANNWKYLKLMLKPFFVLLLYILGIILFVFLIMITKIFF